MALIHNHIQSVFTSRYLINTPSEPARAYLNYYTVCGYRDCEENYRRNISPGYIFLILTDRGQGKIRCDTKTWTLDPGSFFFSEPGSTYQIDCGGDGSWGFYWIDIFGQSVCNMLHYCRDKFGNWFYLNNFPLIRQKIEQLMLVQDNSISRKEYTISDMLYSLINDIIYSRINEVEKLDKNGTIVSKICGMIDRAPENEYDIRQLSRQYYISENHLIRIFNQVIGCPPYTYILNKRIQKAKNLLLHSHISVGEAASLCGFKNQSNFTRKFKEETGMTPSEYRKSADLLHSDLEL